MGLDQWAWRISRKNALSEISIVDDSRGDEIYYWRKVPDLHGWMENLYREKGGKEKFNCEVVQLTEEDLDRLEKDVKQSKLPHTEGFFFGVQSPEDDESILEFIDKARKVINEGDCVYYDSWW